ncbi:MAG: bifunctional adenosylcobinamide kinase/adenosylcobinamide-phosphate guanylyltransferase [Planctomycetota bacterium]|jgi:adenosylcobinamide kinase/adenosylcobinamide-phosphate guanylyltransferase
MADLIMVAGGSRSGKSAVAEALLDGFERLAYIATLEILDEEMRERVALHRSRRSSAWQTVEAPHYLERAIRDLPPCEGVLLDCLTGWLSNRLLAEEQACAEGERVALDGILEELDGVLRAVVESPVKRLVVVTNEVGSGVVPPSSLGRRFRDLQGWANQRLAAAAERVLLVQFGLVSELKSESVVETMPRSCEHGDIDGVDGQDRQQ